MAAVMSETWGEQDTMLRDSVARFIEHEYGFEQRRQRLRAPPEDRGAWAQFAEFGWLGLPFAEEHGGFGAGASEVAMLLREFGRALVIEPYVANVVLAGGLLARLGTPAQTARYLAPMIEGRAQLALAFAEAASRYRLDDCQTTAVADGNGWRLQGHKTAVMGGANADAFVVVARNAGARVGAQGLSLFIVERTAPGAPTHTYRMQDGHNGAELHLDGVQLGADALLGRLGEAHGELERALDEAAAMACAEAIGVMQVLFEDTLAYLKERRQFGRALASNQALQHRLVDMHIQWREADAMAAAAVQSLAADDITRARTVSAAKLHVSQALRLLGQEAVQLHGAIGTTDDFHISHYFKRATMLSLMFGDADFHRRRFANALRTGAAA